jgi:hypothetical protein
MKSGVVILISLISLNSCSDNADSEQTKAMVENLKKEYKGDYQHIPLDTADIAFISGHSFIEIEKTITTNVYCGKCNDAQSGMHPFRFYFNLDQLTISFDGTCLMCNDTLTAGYAMHNRIDYLVKVLNKKNAVAFNNNCRRFQQR